MDKGKMGLRLWEYDREIERMERSHRQFVFVMNCFFFLVMSLSFLVGFITHLIRLWVEGK